MQALRPGRPLVCRAPILFDAAVLRGAMGSRSSFMALPSCCSHSSRSTGADRRANVSSARTSPSFAQIRSRKLGRRRSRRRRYRAWSRTNRRHRRRLDRGSCHHHRRRSPPSLDRCEHSERHRPLLPNSRATSRMHPRSRVRFRPCFRRSCQPARRRPNRRCWRW